MEVLVSFIAVLEIWSFLQKETVGQTVTLRIGLRTTAEVPCVYPDLAELVLAAQWYKISNSGVFVNDGRALAWRNNDNGETGGSLGYSMKDNFALVMRNFNITDRGLYRCAVTPAGNVDDYTYDVNIEVYALPSGPPLIEYARQANESRVICSVNNIYPMASPELKLQHGSTEPEVQPDVNEDGTFNITTIKYIPCSEEDLDAACSYSNLNYNRTSSLRIPSCFSDPSRESDELPIDVPCTDLKNRDPPRGRWIGWTTFILEGFVFIAMMAFACREKIGLSIKQCCRRKDDNKRTSTFYYAVFMGIFHVIIFIVSVVYLATTRK